MYSNRNFKTAFDYFVKIVFNKIVKTNLDKAWLMTVDETVTPIFCSDKDMASTECRIMLGKAMIMSLGHFTKPPKELFDEELKPVNEDGSTNTKYTFITVMKDLSKEDAKLEVIQLNSTNYGAASKKHKELVDYKMKDSMKIGFMTHSSI